jgi:eukaryotic-like serine/threonine-protein kinase
VAAGKGEHQTEAKKSEIAQEVAMHVDPNQVKEIFLAAAERPAGERLTFLDQACGEWSVLRRRVELLLDAHDRGNHLTDQPHGGGAQNVDLTQAAPKAVAPSQTNVANAPGAFLGPYKLLQQIGEGGMGTVWMAEQYEPVRRKVALKVIKAGMDSKEVLARFEAERQALALMDHPNIARVLDAGRTGAGLPYFVMELVKGVPITKYCDEHQLSTPERLELFIQVCQAIQHAHQKGVIHRDIKPTNVMVASYDGRPVPKVIDFGIAKAMGQQLTERTLFTTFGGIVGTLEYMSPEQAELNALDIDTRSDIYALGVLLYELLTGTTPLTRQRLKQAALSEALRMIREEEPPKPSTRLSESKQSLSTVAARRKSEPAKLRRLVRGELDWLVMKALDKDRNRRYETANSFILDIQRYLHDEPVLASPPSTVYRLRKFAKRNKGPLVAAVVVLLALSAGFVGTVLGLLEARTQRDAAELAQGQEFQQRLQAEEERDKAKKAEAAAQQARLEEAHQRMVAQEAEEKAKIARAAEAHERKLAEADRDRAKNAEAVAKEQERLANEQKTKAVESDKEARASDAEARAVLGFFTEKVLSAARPKNQAGGLGFDATIRAALDAAEPGIAQSFKGNPKAEASIRYTLGMTYWYLGQPKLAIRQHERALQLRQKLFGPEAPETLTCMNSLAMAYTSDGRLDDALPLYERTLEIRKATAGLDDPNTLTNMNNLAIVYTKTGRFKEAFPLYEETLNRRRATLGPGNLFTLQSMNNLGGAYLDLGKLSEAIALFDETLKLRKSKLSIQHPETLTTMNNLARAYQLDGRIKDALPLFEDTLKLRQTNLPPQHYDTMLTMNSLAECYEALKQAGKAEPLRRELAVFWQKKAGPDSPQYATQQSLLGSSLLQQQKFADAEPILRGALTAGIKHQPNDWAEFHNKSLLGESLMGQKKYEEAEPFLLQGYEGMKQFAVKTPPQGQSLTDVLDRIVQLYEATEQPAQAEKWRKERERIKQK